MRAQQFVLILSTMLASGLGVQPAASQGNQGTADQQMACTPDVWRLCSQYVPDRDSIVSCLRQNTSQLSGPCRAVFDTSNPAPQQSRSARRGAPRPVAPRPPAYEVDDGE
ncbi:hypothetical protein ACQR16_27715 [Bradyrhizobium oligotrophicum]|uniref:hypothetical protein n=1 Tax=Bradyrhizobium oligotrophicum TaxID=44255 RepID=UPI003EBBCCD9